MRKVYAQVTVRLVILADDDANVLNELNEMDYNFWPEPNGKIQIEDMEVVDYDIKDSK